MKKAKEEEERKKNIFKTVDGTQSTSYPKPITLPKSPKFVGNTYSNRSKSRVKIHNISKDFIECNSWKNSKLYYKFLEAIWNEKAITKLV